MAGSESNVGGTDGELSVSSAKQRGGRSQWDAVDSPISAADLWLRSRNQRGRHDAADRTDQASPSSVPSPSTSARNRSDWLTPHKGLGQQRGQARASLFADTSGVLAMGLTPSSRNHPAVLAHRRRRSRVQGARDQSDADVSNEEGDRTLGSSKEPGNRSAVRSMPFNIPLASTPFPAVRKRIRPNPRLSRSTPSISSTEENQHSAQIIFDDTSATSSRQLRQKWTGPSPIRPIRPAVDREESPLDLLRRLAAAPGFTATPSVSSVPSHVDVQEPIKEVSAHPSSNRSSSKRDAREASQAIDRRRSVTSISGSVLNDTELARRQSITAYGARKGIFDNISALQQSLAGSDYSGSALTSPTRGRMSVSRSHLGQQMAAAEASSFRTAIVEEDEEAEDGLKRERELEQILADHQDEGFTIPIREDQHELDLFADEFDPYAQDYIAPDNQDLLLYPEQEGRGRSASGDMTSIDGARYNSQVLAAADEDLSNRPDAPSPALSVSSEPDERPEEDPEDDEEELERLRKLASRVVRIQQRKPRSKRMRFSDVTGQEVKSLPSPLTRNLFTAMVMPNIGISSLATTVRRPGGARRSLKASAGSKMAGKLKVDGTAFDVVEDLTHAFFIQLAETFAKSNNKGGQNGKRKRRSTISTHAMVRLLREREKIGSRMTLISLARKYLPRELSDLIAPELGAVEDAGDYEEELEQQLGIDDDSSATESSSDEEDEEEEGEDSEDDSSSSLSDADSLDQTSRPRSKVFSAKSRLKYLTGAQGNGFESLALKAQRKRKR